MAMPLLQVLASGQDLLSQSAQDQVADLWVQWRATTKDIAPAIADVLNGYQPDLGAESLRRTAVARFAFAQGGSAGNASLMRTTPITLGYLFDPDRLAAAARVYSDLTHGNPEAGDACVLWNLAQRHAILNAEFDLAVGLPWIPERRQAMWAQLITQAEVGPPEDFAVRNAWVSQVLQTAWSAINHCDVQGAEHFEETLRLAVAAGGDTATVAAVAGGLLGARWGVSAIPLEWRRRVFGWPDYRDADLLHDSYRVVKGRAWPGTFHEDAREAAVVAHPQDDGLLVGGLRGLSELPSDIGAVVSLCRLGASESVPEHIAADNHVQVWLADSADPADNPHLAMVAGSAVEMLVRLRAQGLRVYLHCDDAAGRSPFIAALYGAEITGMPARDCLLELSVVLTRVDLNPMFDRFLHQVG
jgi:ADP-ribosylglycohydrolase